MKSSEAIHSAIYTGKVSHERRVPRRHAFRYRVFFLYVDLDELPELFDRRWLWSARGPNLVRWKREDYMGPKGRPLREVVLDKVERELGRRPEGAVRVLTQPRMLGYVFNPVSFYYCFDADGALDAVAAEITNTPWRERHTYVLDARAQAPNKPHRFVKDFHVSPFFGMDQEYVWSFAEPGERLAVHMTNVERGETVFHAGLEAERRPMTAGSLAWTLLRYPWQTARVHFAIYLQAARLWLKKTPFFVHPEKRALAEGAEEAR